MALASLRDGEAAEEVAQESLARVVRAIREGRLHDPANLGAFARAIARNVIVDTLRLRKRVTPLEPDHEPASEEDALRTLVTAEQLTQLRVALERLSSQDHELLRLSFFEGLSPQELAERLEVPSTRIRKRKERALERLRAAFFEAAGHASPPTPTQPAEARQPVARPGTLE